MTTPSALLSHHNAMMRGIAKLNALAPRKTIKTKEKCRD
jgi:hypothetical protein